MKVQIIRSSDDYVLNVRYTDELVDDGTLEDGECDEAERCIKERGRYYFANADTYLKAA